MKRTILSIVLAAVLLVPVVGRPEPASADCSVLQTWVNIISAGLGCLALPFGATQPACPMQQVDVTTAPSDETDRIYKYDLACSSTDLIHVSAEFNATTQRGTERLTGDSGNIEAEWTNCSNDPWLDGSATCTNGGVEASAQTSQFNLSAATFPFSAQFLSDSSRHVLDEQLQNAFKQVPAAPTIDLHANQTRLSASCVACVVSAATSSAPTLPDFAISSIIGNQQPTQGFTGTYDVILANLGAAPSGQVQVQISVNGSLRYLQMAQTPAGWTCLGNISPITCTGPLGGVGAPPTSVEFQIQAQAAQTGTGSISAYADPNNVIQESNENNNGQTLPVTVK
jgi:hypothetical protein